jgi:glycosyltransferase involved in cell wall biosynthesis
MKLLTLGQGHNKNWNGIQLMCASMGIDLELTTDASRLTRFDYDILISVSKYFHIEQFPRHIKLIFGPHFFPKSHTGMHGTLCNTSERAAFNTLSLWNETNHNILFGSLVVPIAQFPYAVDVNRFSAKSTDTATYDCLIYFKHRDPALLHRATEILQSKGISHRFIRYGSYSEQHYMDELKQCKFMLVIDAHESQGFALQEAMSTNTPLLVLDATSLFDEILDNGVSEWKQKTDKFIPATSVPYWSDAECGIRITNIDDLPCSVETMSSSYQTFTPRDYVVRTLSPKACMKRILDYFDLDISTHINKTD